MTPSFVDYTVGFFLLALGLVTLAMLFAPGCLLIAQRYKQRAQTRHLSRGAAALTRADELIKNRDLAAASKILRQAVVTEILNDRETIIATREHHQNILSRFVLIAEEQKVRLPNLGELERLFYELAEIQSTLLRANESYARMSKKRASENKGMPQWSRSEFSARKKTITEQLIRVSDKLEVELDSLISRLSAPPTEEILYH